MKNVLPMVDTAVETCCSPITEGILTVDEATSLAQKFKAMGDPTRLQLLSMVAAAESGEACVCDLTAPLGLSQGTISFHLGKLVSCGLLTRTRRGTWSYYALVPDALPALADTLLV